MIISRHSALILSISCHVSQVVLAKEAGLPYASLALVTDYDSWRDDHEAVSTWSLLLQSVVWFSYTIYFAIFCCYPLIFMYNILCHILLFDISFLLWEHFIVHSELIFVTYFCCHFRCFSYPCGHKDKFYIFLHVFTSLYAFTVKIYISVPWVNCSAWLLHWASMSQCLIVLVVKITIWDVCTHAHRGELPTLDIAYMRLWNQLCLVLEVQNEWMILFSKSKE